MRYNITIAAELERTSGAPHVRKFGKPIKLKNIGRHVIARPYVHLHSAWLNRPHMPRKTMIAFLRFIRPRKQEINEKLPEITLVKILWRFDHLAENVELQMRCRR